jgi:hypothetical protein
MANQAIALQARAPQGNFLAPAIQQGAQFINMMSQQRAAERQAAAQQQSMQLQLAGEERAKAGEARAADKAKLDREADIYVKYRRLAPVVAEGGPAVYANYLQRMAVDSPESAAAFAQTMPVDKFDKDTFTRMIMGADEYAASRYGKAITKEFITPEGGVMGANISGFPGATYATPVPDISQPRTPMAAPTTPTATAPTAPPVAAPAPAAGGMFRPAAFSPDQGGGMDANAGLQAVQTAMKTKMIDPATLDQVRQMAGPQAAAVDAWMRKNGIKVSPGGGMQSAVYRPEGGAPMAQQVQYDPNAYAPLRAKSPMQSPAPGIYNVPTPQIAGAAGAEEGGKQGVRVVTEPKIVAGTERVKRLEKLRGDQPLALSDAKSVITDMDDRIAAIDEFLRNPNRRSIIGSVEGRIPKFVQNERRADVQALYDSIVSNQVLNELIKGRQQTETGASPQGIVSDKDLAVAAQASNRLTQTGSEEVQEREMQRLRDVLYRTRQLAIKTYTDTYREVAKDAPELRLDAAPIADRYKAVPEAPASKTPVTKPPAGISAEDWKYMTPEGRRLWQN